MGNRELFAGYRPPRKRAYGLQAEGVDDYEAWQIAWIEQLDRQQQTAGE